MKKTFLFMAVMAIVATLPSCDKVTEALFKPFDATIGFDASIQPTAVGASTTSVTTPVNFNLKDQVKASTGVDVNTDIITQAYLKQVDVTVNSPVGDAANNLTNFESVSIKIESPSTAAVVLGPYPVPSTATSFLSIQVANSPNIRQYFNASNVTFSLIAKAKTATTKTIAANIKATVNYQK
jgi:hypothetical protein